MPEGEVEVGSDEYWVEELTEEYSDTQLLAALLTAKEIKHRKYLSRGLTAMLGVAAIASIEKLRIQNEELVISWAENPRFMTSVYSGYFAGVLAVGNKIKATVIESKAPKSYKEVRNRTGFRIGRLTSVIEDAYHQSHPLDIEPRV